MTTPLPTPLIASTSSSSSSASATLASSLQPFPSKTISTTSDVTTDLKTRFDDIAMSIISYLQLFDEVSNITVESKSTRISQEIPTWEKTHYPYKIPEDMKAFYNIFNGKEVVILHFTLTINYITHILLYVICYALFLRIHYDDYLHIFLNVPI